MVNIYEHKPKDFVIEGGILKKYKGASVDVVIPDGVIEIGENSFTDLKIKSVVIPGSVASIGHSAFYNCTSLTALTIPNNVNKNVFMDTPWYKEAEEKEIVAKRKNAGLCQRCGGEFKGLFSKKM